MKTFVAGLLIVFSLVANAATEVRIIRQVGQSSNMMLLYPTIKTFEQLSQEAGIPIQVTLQPIDNVSTGVTNMLAGNTDIIMGAIIPFVFANDKAPGRLRLLSGSNIQNMDLICTNPAIKKVSDIKPHHKIAMKTLGSSDHFMLRGVAKKFFNDYYYLDKNIITMPRMQIAAFMSSRDKSIDCAVPGTPLQGSLVQSGYARLIFSSDQKQVLGNIHGTWSTTKWVNENPKLAELWVKSVAITSKQLEKNINPAIAMFIEYDSVKDSAAIVKETLGQSKQRYSVQPVAIYEQMQLLYNMDLIKTPPVPVEQLLWKPELVK